MPISFDGWVTETREAFEESPKWAVANALRCVYLGAWLTATSRYPVGTNVYEREWDALIVLDACRVDALREVAPEYDFLEDVGSIWSVGSESYEWLVKTFTTDYIDEIRRTAHVTSNGFSNGAFIQGRYAPSISVPFGWPKDNVVSEDDFAYMEHAWQHGRDESLRSVPPRYMTDRAIEVGRTVDADRYVFHYVQPHTPYLADAMAEGREVTDVELDPWPYLRRGEADPKVIWEAYVDNLRLVLDDLELLLENIDAERVAITADHGEMMGEWGIHGHPAGLPAPPLKKVPWAVTTATDTGSYEPSSEIEGPEADVEEHLADLGYL